MPNLLSPAVDKLAFRPPRPSYRKEDVTLWIETDRGSWIPAIHLNRGFKFTLLISHGNAEDMGDSARLWQVLSEILRVNVFCYEYSGYGHATGKPSEENLYSDARAAVHLLVNELGLKASSEIVLVGKSLGSCAVCHLASRGTTYRGYARYPRVCWASPLATSLLAPHQDDPCRWDGKWRTRPLPQRRRCALGRRRFQQPR